MKSLLRGKDKMLLPQKGFYSSNHKIVPDDQNWLRALPTYLNNNQHTVKDPYSQSVYIYAGIRAMSVNISGVPFKLRDRNTKDVLTEESNPWFRVFKNPHILLEGSQLWRATVIHYESCGTCFWLLLNSSGEPITSPTEVPAMILPFGSDRVVPRFPDGDNSRTNLLGWTYVRDAQNNDLVPLEFYQVLRFYEYNPKDMTTGFTGLTPAKMSIDIDYQTHLFNQKFFYNGADVGGILKYSGEGLDGSELEAMRDLWDSRHTGLQNAKRTPILGQGFDYKETGKSHKDMEFRELYNITREEQIAALNVPKQQVSLYEEINFATARVADKAFWTNNLIPKMNYFVSVINSHLLDFTQYEGFFDLTKVEALNESRDEKLSNAKALQEMGYPLNEINDKLGLGMDTIDEEWANTPTNIYAVSQNSQEDTEETEEEESEKALAKEFTEIIAKSLGEDLNFSDEDINSMNRKDLTDLSWQSNQKAIDRYVADYNKSNRIPIEKEMLPKVKGYILKLKKDQIKKLNNILNKNLERGEIESVLFDINKWNKTIIEMGKPFHEKAFNKAFDQLEIELDGFVSFDRGSNEVAEQLRQTNVQIAQVNDTIQKQIRSTLAAGVSLSETPDQLRNRVAKEFDNMLSRAGTISATEVGIASSRAKYIGMQAEDCYKKWVSSRDGKVRDPHVDYNKLPEQHMDYEYAPGLKRPLDETADPKQICNCRCVLIAKRKPKVN